PAGAVVPARVDHHDPGGVLPVLAVVGGEAEPYRVRLVQPGEQVDGLRARPGAAVLPGVEQVDARPRGAEPLLVAEPLQLLDRLARSEERRVGKECRARETASQYNK